MHSRAATSVILLLALTDVAWGFLSWPGLQLFSRFGRSGCDRIIDGIEMCDGYQTHEEMEAKLRRLEDAHPDLIQISSLGKSVQGRQLTFAKISRGVRGERDMGEPMVKFVANAHGDETLGRQLLVFLAEFLVEKYGADPR